MSLCDRHGAQGEAIELPPVAGLYRVAPRPACYLGAIVDGDLAGVPDLKLHANVVKIV